MHAFPPGATEPFQTLEEALTALVRCLKAFVPCRIWMVARVHDDDWNVLVVDDSRGEVQAGATFHWPDTYCARMVAGNGPRFAPDAQSVPAYAAAEIKTVMRVGAYIGQPLVSTDGALLGTLCAVDAEPSAGFTPEQTCLVETISRTISTLMTGKMNLEELRQTEANLRYLAEQDPLTGLSNRHGWEMAMAEEEAALQGMGENAMVLMVDLDGLKQANDTMGHAFGDQYIVRAAHTLRRQLRDTDVSRGWAATNSALSYETQARSRQRRCTSASRRRSAAPTYRHRRATPCGLPTARWRKRSR